MTYPEAIFYSITVVSAAATFTYIMKKLLDF